FLVDKNLRHPSRSAVQCAICRHGVISAGALTPVVAGLSKPEITPPSNSNHIRDGTSLGEYKGPSAVALKDLRHIQKLLSAVPLSEKAVRDKARDLLDNLDKNILISIAGECGQAIEALRTAFR